MWHPSVSAFTGYRAGHFLAWELPPGSQRTSKLSTLLLKHLVLLCNRGLHSAFLWADGYPVACLSADVAVAREYATLILLQPTRATLAL